jgi:Flp pilus assembly pilin Flp
VTVPRDRGATMIEYAMIVLLVILVTLSLIQLLGGSVLGMFQSLVDHL